MTAAANKQLLQHAFAELAQGNGKPFVDLMAEDFSWTIIGTTPWSGSYRGKQTVRDKLLRPLFAQFTTQYTNTALRMIAEDDYVVVECRGRVMTQSGKPYNNEYCNVIRFADGQMRELMEYFDTELVNSVLRPPETAASADT
jgi:hypothetical protein